MKYLQTCMHVLIVLHGLERVCAHECADAGARV